MIIYKKIDYFQKFFEGRGVNNKQKDFIDGIMKYINESNDEHDSIEIDCEEMNMLKMTLTFEKSSNSNYGLFNPLKCKFVNGYLEKVHIDIKYTDKIKLHETLYHELNHVNDFFNYIKLSNLNLKARNYTLINKSLQDINIDKSSNLFLYLIYITLDNELNARISQLYSKLILNRNKNEQYLIDIIKKSDTYILYETIKNYNVVDNINSLKRNFSDTELLSMFRMINDSFIKNEIYKNKRFLFIKNYKFNTVNDIEYYMIKWKKVFDSKMKKHYKKMFGLLKEIKKDVKYVEFLSQKDLE